MDEEYGAYTEDLYNRFWEYDEQNDDVNSALSILNDNAFRPFSVRLIEYLREYSEETLMDAGSAAQYLRSQAKSRAVPLNRNTIKNWCMGSSEPKHGGSDRDKMFQVAFALGLDVRQAADFFHRVVLDRPVNRRDPHEFIYYYCLINHRPWKIANDIFHDLNIDSSEHLSEDELMFATNVLGNSVLYNINDDEVARFIRTHPQNFALNNTKAKEILGKHLSMILGSKAENRKGLAELVCEKRFVVDSGIANGEKAVPKNMNPHSRDFFLLQVKGMQKSSPSDSVRKMTQNQLKLKEIFDEFPDAATFAKDNPSSYILRKELILTHFFLYFGTCLIDGVQSDYEEFESELNSELFSAGLCRLYPGNPYDWLFLWCAARENPLDSLQQMLNEKDDF